jgi:pimeloyl-ACP methyl ester carboxylesterase
VESSARDVLNLLRQLRMFPNMLVGHSFGGKVVMSMAHQFGASLPRPVQVRSMTPTDADAQRSSGSFACTRASVSRMWPEQAAGICIHRHANNNLAVIVCRVHAVILLNVPHAVVCWCPCCPCRPGFWTQCQPRFPQALVAVLQAQRWTTRAL